MQDPRQQVVNRSAITMSLRTASLLLVHLKNGSWYAFVRVSCLRLCFASCAFGIRSVVRCQSATTDLQLRHECSIPRAARCSTNICARLLARTVVQQIAPSPELVRLELTFPAPSMLCALQSDWLMVSEWALLLSSEAMDSTGAVASDSSFAEILLVGPDQDPTSAVTRYFSCTSASRARLELRQSSGGQYGLTELTLLGYDEADDGMCQLSCHNGGSCQRTADGCRCPRGRSCRPYTRGCGWTGDLCTIDIDECALGVGSSSSINYGGCGNGGVATIQGESGGAGDPERAVCTNLPGSWTCECKEPAWRGRSTANGGNICVDANECHSSLNRCEGSCQNTVGGFRCSCPAGEKLDEGYRCNPDCGGRNCLHNGRCETPGGDCVCLGGFTGRWCETMGDESLADPWYTRTFGVDRFVFFTAVSVVASVCLMITVATAIARQHVKENALAEESAHSESALLLAEIPSDDAAFEDVDEEASDYFYGADRAGRRGRRASRQLVRVRMPAVSAPAPAAAAAAAGPVRAENTKPPPPPRRQKRVPHSHTMALRSPPLPPSSSSLSASSVGQQQQQQQPWVPPPPPVLSAGVEAYLRKDPRRRSAGPDRRPTDL